jgi:hypothetical protein
LLLYDGSPLAAGKGTVLFDLRCRCKNGPPHFGTSAKFIDAAAKTRH